MKNQGVHRLLGAFLFAVSCVFSVYGQATTGGIRGVVTDQNAAVVSGAKVTLTRKSTGGTQTAQTNTSGQFEFSNLLPADDYGISVEAANFKNVSLTDVRVSTNQITDLPVELSPGQVTETVTVTAGGVELVDTTSANLSKAFSSRQVVELAQTTAGPAGSPAGVNNLALLAPGVTSSGGVGVGTGGSVGGQRPRNNNFIVDGVDNNDKSVTGPQSYISPEEVAEFTLLQNQFSAEFARSNGGNFLTVTKSGTNDFHGSAYGFVRNRYLNALDTIQKNAGVTRDENDENFMPRSDYFRGGFNIGGPFPLFQFGEGMPPGIKLGKDKLFFFTSYERVQTGSSIAAGGIVTPTAQGFNIINATPGLSATNVGVFNQFTPVAPVANIQQASCVGDCVTVGGVPIPLGTVTFPAPNFFKQNHAVINLDYLQTQNTQHHVRFTFTNGADIDNAANLPVFFIAIPSKQRLFSYTLIHNFSERVINETRGSFRRSSNNFPVPGITFPGLTVFPNIILDDLGLNIGPDPNAPQFGIENNYQIVNNLTWLRNNHSFKFGGDFRWVISPQSFSQRVRGDYEYLTTETFLRDLSPDAFGQRNAGNNIYYGNQKVLYAFAQDDWRIRPNFTLNLGVSYSYQQVPLGARTSQPLNAISSVPGVLEFREPKAQTKNFAPKVGFAWSPDYKEGLLGRIFGSGGKSSIRAGFSMGYDYIFDNLYILSNPPQLQQTNDVDTSVSTPNFLANGGLPDSPVAVTDPVAARQNTASFIPDQEVPYSITWTGSYQRQLGDDYSLELRYVGTRGIHLITQNRLNFQAKVAPEDGRRGLPTFITRPSAATIDALTLDLSDIRARSQFVPRFEAAGFDGAGVTAFLSNGNSSYHGGSVQLTKRLSRGFQMTAAYTLSHLIDDTTAEVFSTVLSPRRVEDFQNLRRERADSALDHRHRFVSSWIYEVPLFSKSTGFTRTLLGGWNLAGTYTYETGERITIRSGNDANLNGDNAGDRAILNPSGTEGVGSSVIALCAGALNCTNAQITAGDVLAYVASNPNARYIQAGSGAESTIGRNTFLLDAINNVDFSIFKNFRIGETKYFQLRADFFNAFNHPQYVPGSVNSVDPVGTTGLTTLNQVNPLTPDFLNPSAVLSSNPRVIQLAARFNF